MTFREWDESKHPRDDEGKFTFKGLGSTNTNNGTLEGKIEKTDGNGGVDWENARDILVQVLSKYITPAVAIYSSISQLRNMIKMHKLEDKLEKALKEVKESKKEKEENNQNNQGSSSVGNSQTPADILYHDSKIKDEQEKQNLEYKNHLLDILGDKATKADVLYATPEKLERKIREYGLQNKLKGTITGDKSAVNQNSTHKEYSKPTAKGIITSPYGNRLHPIKKVTKLHDGIDIGVPIGTPVSAVTNGKVTFVGKKTGYGNYIEIQYKNSNGDNITTFYAHLNDFKTKDGTTLKVGQIVKQGELIGHSGNTGIGTGAHLHFGARKNNKSINPIDIIGNVYTKK